jgi:hypothetical protein
MKSFRLIPKKRFQKTIFILCQKGYLEKSGFWSIKIRIALCVYISIKNLISQLCIYKISIIDLILD